MIIDGIDFSSLIKAFKKFESFRLNDKTEQEKAGIIQAYEYCFELTWKLMKKVLEARGQRVNSPKETFRVAAKENFIDDPEIWFDFLKKRNLTVHTYDEKEIEKVLSVCPSFSDELKKLLERLES